ncbi:transaldolase [Desemzia sp. C1]|uniref:transaldolase family protein n=1 Tax=Desemzia sp. C1 TaxID=2892016 RepID=UPI001E4E6426|nr:transaldolase family protein [Desemzia sp. C1]MCI3028787.1 transaldolase [Desemzia sp. C1]
MFLDTVNINEINKQMKLGILKGVTSNPTLLFKEKRERFTQIKEMLSTQAPLVFVQVVGETVEEATKDYQKIMSISTDKKIGIKVSLNSIGLMFIKEVKQENPEQILLGTAVYSADQGILGALAGCDYVAPYVNRMSNNNIDPFQSIHQIRMFIDDRNLETKIMGASFKNTNQVLKALMAGAHTATIPTDILEQMINKELAVDAIKTFNHHHYELQNNNVS